MLTLEQKPIEGAYKTCKRVTGRSEIISCKGSYHGSTHGSFSIMGNEEQKKIIVHYYQIVIQLNIIQLKSLEKITNKTAVVIEIVQGGTGFITSKNNFLQKIRQKCNNTETLLIFDEIQTCYGRLGTLFGFEQYNVVPDILCIKGMGQEFSIGAFISSWNMMNLLTFEPKLGHITTFGGHPVNCAKFKLCLQHLNISNIIREIKDKRGTFRTHLSHPKIKEIRGKGLILSIELGDEKLTKKVVEKSLENGLILFYFLFTKTSFRITPPLTISDKK